MASRLHCFTNVVFGTCTSLSKASKREKNKKHKKSTSLKKGTHHLHEDTHSVDKHTQYVNDDTQNQQDDRNNAGRHGEGKISQNIFKIKNQLRPLLDAIISVESDKMNRKEGCKGGTRIGMLQINEQYHRDAWGPNASSCHRSQCRDTEYAENTVVVFWLRHCPDAVINNDWETLARIHHGGPEGLGTNSTNHYWSEICRWLEQNLLQAPSVSEPYKNSSLLTTVPVQSMTASAEQHILADISNLHVSNNDVAHTQKRQNGRQVWHMKKINKQSIKDDSKESSTSVFQPVQHISNNLKAKGTNYSCPRNRSQFPLTNAPFITNGTRSNSVINKRRKNSLNFGSSNNLLKVWKLSHSIQREKAAMVVQAYCRMFLIKKHYKRTKSAVLKIQRWWRQYGNKGILFENYSTVQSMETVFQGQFLYHRNQPPIVFSQIQDENAALPSNVELLQSPADLLYKGNISAAEEEKVLTELANLLSPSNNNGLEQFNFFESGIVDEELENFQFPFLQDGESEKSTPVLTRIHSPKLRGTCLSHENNSFGDMENIMSEWLELKKSDFMDIDGGNTNFMPIQADEAIPDFVNIISERKQLYDAAMGSVAASANCSHFCNCSDNWKEYFSKKISPGLWHSQFKTFCLDESPNVNIYEGINEENTGEIWSRNISSVERRGKAGLPYKKLLGRLEVESKTSKVVPDNNFPKLIGLDFHKGFPREKEFFRAHEAISDDENVSKKIRVDLSPLGLMGNIKRLESCEYRNNTMVFENSDPPLSVVAMLCCRFPEALFTTSFIALQCSDVHLRKQKVRCFSGMKEVESLSYGFYFFL